MSAANWRLPRAFAICLCGTEPYAAVAVDLQHVLKGVQGGEGGALCSRKTNGICLLIDIFRN